MGEAEELGRGKNLRQPAGQFQVCGHGAIECVKAGTRRECGVGTDATRQTGGDEVAGCEEPSRTVEDLRLVGADPGDLGRATARTQDDASSMPECSSVPEVLSLGDCSRVRPEDPGPEWCEIAIEARKRLSCPREPDNLDGAVFVGMAFTQLRAGLDNRAPPVLGVLLGTARCWMSCNERDANEGHELGP